MFLTVLALLLLAITSTVFAAHRKNSIVTDESTICDVHFPLSFLSATHESGKTFWWAEGGVRGIGGESWHSIQTWFNSVEYGSMKVLSHVFNNTEASTNYNANRVVLDIGSHQGTYACIMPSHQVSLDEYVCR